MLALAPLLLLGLVLAVSAGAVYVVRQLTRPPRRTYSYALARNWPADPGVLSADLGGPASFESWTARLGGSGGTGGGPIELPVWDVPGLNPNGPLVVISHGWGESRLHGLWRLEAYRGVASRVVIWDMPGHGEAPRNSICTLGVHEPQRLIELVAFLREHDADRPVLLVGSSLGAGISIAAATVLNRVVGVVAEAPYRLAPTPATNVMRFAGYPFRATLPLAFIWLTARLGRGRFGSLRAFDRLDSARVLSVPLLVLHGEHDAVSPPADGRAIAEAAPGGLGTWRMIDGGQHLDLWIKPELRAKALAATGAWLAGLPIR